MSVLQREIDAYQRALAAYKRQAASHNSKVRGYNETLVKDAQGRILVTDNQGRVYSVNSDGRLNETSLPGGKLSDYGTSAIEGESRFSLLRQGSPVESKRETKSGVFRFQDPDTGEQYYYTMSPDYGDGGAQQQRLGPEWRIDAEQPGAWESGGGDSGSYQAPNTYTVSRDVSLYAAKPGDPPVFNRVAPSATYAETARAGRPSLAQIEAGLIGEVMRGSGIRY